MHLPQLIQDLAVILAVAGVIGVLFQRIRQPVVLGYLIAGMIVGPHTPPFQLVTDLPSIRTWAELGVIFLMFSLGLEFSFRKLAKVGVSAGIAAGAEVLFFLPVGYGIGKLFGWSSIDSIFLGAMLAISSTTIIIKALDELKLKTRRFAELIFAILIVEDLIAILLLVGLTTVATSDNISGLALLLAAGKLVLVVGGWIIAGYFIVPRLMQYVSRIGNGNNEMLTLLSLGLCLGLVVFATRFHYSAALGAFIMGSILSESPVLDRIEARMESLRDLFGAVFFVSIGMLIDPKMLWEYRVPVVVLCLVTIVGKIVSTGFGALISGQTFKNSVRVGFGLAQIGEFSFIIAGLGMSLGATSDFIYPIGVAVSLVTTFTTPYLIQLSGPLAEKLDAKLPTRIKDLLLRYAVWSEARRTEAQQKKEFYTQLMKWLINGVVVSVIFVLSNELLLPLLERKNFAGPEALPAITWVVALATASPFIWAMLSAFSRRGQENSAATKMFSLFFFRLITVVWVGFLSANFFPTLYVVFIVSVCVILLFGLFYRRLENSYQWFEEQFLSTFTNGKGHQTKPKEMRKLAPWDAHLVTIKVHPNATFSGKRLADVELRNKFGVNIVSIKRGVESFVAPKPEEQLFPGDELLVLSTDEQLEKARPFLEVQSSSITSLSSKSDYELRHVQLVNKELLRAGVTIRSSGIRERFSAMVVGVERNHRRYLNPDSDMSLQHGDILWLVGPIKNLEQLRQELQTS